MEELERQIALVSHEVDMLYHEKQHSIGLEEKREKLLAKLHELETKYRQLEDIEFIKNRLFDVSDGEIDLYLRTEENLEYLYYLIFLHGTQTCIGEIKYMAGGRENIFNISYKIKDEFRGHGYALKALKLMTDELYKNGIDKVYISAEKNNIPSIKTIKRFGGKKVNEFWRGQAATFECDLHKIKNNRSRKIN